MDPNPELKLGLKSRRKRLRLRKGYENEGVEQVDRISKLPDHIIDYILSFLETKEAVRTSILSSRWRYIWQGITRLTIWSSSFALDKFVKFVEHVLFNCTSRSLEEVKLYCPDTIDFSRLCGWICCAQVRNIKKLILSVTVPFMEMPERPLPTCILSCTTLVALELRSCFDIDIPNTVSCFPYLKSLRLCFISPDHDAVMHKLLSCSPVLEELHLYGHLDNPETFTLNISVPTLRRLTLWIKDEGNATGNDYQIIINTPCLEYLFINDNSLPCYVLKNLYRIRDVHVNYQAICLENLLPKHMLRLFMLMIGVCGTKILTLHSPTLDVLGSALSHTWPSLPFLIYLILQTSSLSSWTCLNVLYSTPNLEVLILDLEEMNDIDNRANRCHWVPPESEPDCLLQSLKTIGIKHFEGNEDELQAVKHLLNNAKVLDLMIIGFHPYPMDEEIVEKLLAFPRASKTCFVKVCEYFWFETELTSTENKISLCGVTGI